MPTWDEEHIFPYMDKGRFAIRAKKLIKNVGFSPCRGKELFHPLEIMDNPLIMVEDGWVTDIRAGKGGLTYGYKKIDISDRCILPPLVNAHTHLQLSWMEDQCSFDYGFIGWLEDLILHLSEVLQNQSEWTKEKRLYKLEKTIFNLRKSGTYYIGDVGGTIPGEISAINELVKDDIHIHNFCEWFGFNQDFENIRETWPFRCREEMKHNLTLQENSSPGGHALYSTSIDILKRAKNWCRVNKKVFSMHLAEPVEEGQCLWGGYGDLFDLYSKNIIPQNWEPYHATPYEVAKNAGLVDKDSLLVHCVHLYKEEIADLAERDAAVCLCPRSNYNLGVGEAPIKAFIQNGVRICLGTDGLSSNMDLNVLNDALYLMHKIDLPFSCVLRLCTVNGADALKFSDIPNIAVGKKARFSSIPVSDID